MDPVTGQKKCEYRCYNIFTEKLSSMQETDQRYGFLFCPKADCALKVGIYSLDGQKCQTCLTMIAPAFQWFRSRLVQNKYGEGGSSLSVTTLSQLNGITTDNVILLGTRTPKIHSARSNSKISIHNGQQQNAEKASKTGG